MMEFLAPRKATRQSKAQGTTNAELLPPKSRKPETFSVIINNLITEKTNPQNCKGKDIYFANKR